MNAIDRQAWARKCSVRVHKARVLDPIENLKRLLEKTHERVVEANELRWSYGSLDRVNECIDQMRPWIEDVKDLVFVGDDAVVVATARRIVEMREVA